MDLKKKWNQFASSSVVIFTIAITFMISPPLLTIEDSSKIDWFVKFLIACTIAIFTIPLLKKSNHTDNKFWQRFAYISFACMLLTIGSYTYYLNNWSVKWYFNKKITIGSTMNEEAKKLKLEEQINEEKLVKMRLGETTTIWPESEIKIRFYILNGLYILSFLLLAGFVISIIQAIYCYEKNTNSP